LAIKDRRGLEGMPLKLLIVSLMISLSAPIVVSSMGTFQARTTESQAMNAAEQIRQMITATYLSGPGNHRIMVSPLSDDKCTIEIGGDLEQMESMTIKVLHDGGTERIYLSDPIVRVTTVENEPFRLTAGMPSLSFTCVSDNGTYVMVGSP
jgi:type II secretory pathway pseudopilin PulG